jgi:hypothetical protein
MGSWLEDTETPGEKQKMLYGERGAGRGEAGREKRAGGGGGEGERMEPRNLPGRGGQGWAESCLGTRRREERPDSVGPRGNVVSGKDDNGLAGACCTELMTGWPTSQTCYPVHGRYFGD